MKYNSKADCHVKIIFKELKDYYEFSVTDNGNGIKPEHRKDIWNISDASSQRIKQKVQELTHDRKENRWTARWKSYCDIYLWRRLYFYFYLEEITTDYFSWKYRLHWSITQHFYPLWVGSESTYKSTEKVIFSISIFLTQHTYIVRVLKPLKDWICSIP